MCFCCFFSSLCLAGILFFLFSFSSFIPVHYSSIAGFAPPPGGGPDIVLWIASDWIEEM